MAFPSFGDAYLSVLEAKFGNVLQLLLLALFLKDYQEKCREIPLTRQCGDWSQEAPPLWASVSLPVQGVAT